MCAQSKTLVSHFHFIAFRESNCSSLHKNMPQGCVHIGVYCTFGTLYCCLGTLQCCLGTLFCCLETLYCCLGNQYRYLRNLSCCLEPFVLKRLGLRTARSEAPWIQNREFRSALASEPPVLKRLGFRTASSEAPWLQNGPF